MKNHIQQGGKMEKDGYGCKKKVSCDQCAHFLWNCSGLLKPSDLGLTPVTQVKRLLYKIGAIHKKFSKKPLHWIDIP